MNIALIKEWIANATEEEIIGTGFSANLVRLSQNRNRRSDV